MASRTITFQGQTFNSGLSVDANLQVNAYAPGYQYDIIRRRRGHLGIRVQLDIFDVQGSLGCGSASLERTAGGSSQSARKSAGSAARRRTRRAFLPTKNSNRIFVTGNVFGMYFFGYGNFISTFDTLGVSATKHFNIRAGYQLGTRLNVNNNASTRIGLDLTQKGPVVGIEVPF